MHKDFFDFTQARADGADLRFSSAAGAPLGYQIEDWDAAAGVATIWARVPKIVGNARQEARLNWGNADAKSESDGKSVFDETNGYLSVWHMNGPARDEVGTLASKDTGTTPCVGVIGPARRFPGDKGVMDAYSHAIWTNSPVNSGDEDSRRHFERLRELFSILRLFVSPTDAVKPSCR